VFAYPAPLVELALAFTVIPKSFNLSLDKKLHVYRGAFYR
jgi:hypothetical protein